MELEHVSYLRPDEVLTVRYKHGKMSVNIEWCLPRRCGMLVFGADSAQSGGGVCQLLEEKRKL